MPTESRSAVVRSTLKCYYTDLGDYSQYDYYSQDVPVFRVIHTSYNTRTNIPFY